MAKGRITINESVCKGCGYCEAFCSHGCIKMQSDRLGPKGTPLPLFNMPDKCNACSICGWMCPEYAIEVYKYLPEPAHK